MIRAKPDTAVPVGRTDMHETHLLYCLKGIWLCCKCGGYCSGYGARNTPRFLGQPCRGKPTRGTRGFLNNLLKGRPPKPGVPWPLPHDLTGRGASLLAADAAVQLKPFRRLTEKQAPGLPPKHTLDEAEASDFEGSQGECLEAGSSGESHKCLARPPDEGAAAAREP